MRSSSQRSRAGCSQRGSSEGSQKVRADDLSEEQIETSVLNVTYFLLCDMRSKKKLRKEEIVTNALNKSSRQYATIMKQVKDNMSNIFGLQLAKLPNNEDAFIIVNKHRTRYNELKLQCSSESEIQDALILTVVLASIFMNRGQMYESHLMAILETIGFLSNKMYDNSCDRKMKDYVSKLVKQEFVRQMYLDAVSVPRPEQVQNPPLPENSVKVTVFRWGFRSYMEVDVEAIVNYLLKIHSGKKPAAFPVGYHNEIKAYQEELRSKCN